MTLEQVAIIKRSVLFVVKNVVRVEMAVVRNEDIDSDSVITGIENRLALFNKTLKDYSDANLKSKLWEHVF